MPRIKPIEVDKATGKTKTLFDAVKKKHGSVANVFRTMAQSPAVLDAYMNCSQSLENCSLDAKTRARIAVAVSNANGCQYCASAHTAIGKKLGLEDLELTQNLEGSSNDERVEAGLEFARTIVAKRGWINDAELKRLRDAGFTDTAIVEIIAVTTMTMFTNYLNHIARTDVDFPKVDVGQPVPMKA